MDNHYTRNDIENIQRLQSANRFLGITLNELYEHKEDEEEIKDSLECRAIAAADKNILLEMFKKENFGTTVEEVIGRAREHIPYCQECSDNYENFLEADMVGMLKATRGSILTSRPSRFRNALIKYDQDFLNIWNGEK